MSTEATHWAMQFRTGRPHLRLVLLLLADSCGMDGSFDCDLTRLAFNAEMTEAEAADVVARLRSLGAVVDCHDCEYSQRLAMPRAVPSPNLVYGVSPSAWAGLRRRVFARDGFVCTYCGSEQTPLHCDHVVPFSKGGETALENLTTACKDCNVSKHARLLSDWRRS